MAKLKKNTKKKILNVVFFGAVFLVALAVYFFMTTRDAEREYTVYTSMEEPTLPVVYAQMEGGHENCLYGYLQDMGNKAATDCITVIPEDRRLGLRISEYDNMVTKVSYEIRSLDLSHYIESTEVRDMERRDGFLYAELPIQNLIERDSQYLLIIHLDTGEKNINYYTKIVWTDPTEASQMLAFAERFSSLTFNYEAAAGELVTYLESSQSAPNDDLGYVNINSSFSQLTWAGSDMRLTTDTEATLREYDGAMGVVEVNYMAERTDNLGNNERYQIKDRFTLRTGTERIYLLNYERETNQIFEGSKHLFAGKRINIGISAPDMLQSMKSDNGRFIAFKADRELWCYDEEEKTAVNIFSFRSGEDDGVRANYDRHDIKILSVNDSGDADFIVYGYMNRGRHEGYNGIAYYQYSRDTNTITESFFIPVAKPFEMIKEEIDKLCTKNDSDMFYVLQNNSVTAVELRSGETMDIASGLSDVSFAVSRDSSKIAWLDDSTGYSKKLQLMDLSSGRTYTLEAGEGEYLRLPGFMDNDIIIGYCRESDRRDINGNPVGIPMYRLSIRDGELNELKSYGGENTYIENVRPEGTRIHLDKLVKTGENSYAYDSPDTIVYKEGLQNEETPGISSYMSESKKKVYYIALSEEIINTRSVNISVPRRISYEGSANIELISSTDSAAMSFYSYSNGKLKGHSSSFMTALGQCYDDIGYVIADNMTLVYNRAAKLGTAELRDPMAAVNDALSHYEDFSYTQAYEDGIILLYAQGINLNQVQYYVFKGTPVILRTDSEGGYKLVCGYDQYNNMRIYDPLSESFELLGEAEAEAYFDSEENDFICIVRQVK